MYSSFYNHLLVFSNYFSLVDFDEKPHHSFSFLYQDSRLPTSRTLQTFAYTDHLPGQTALLKGLAIFRTHFEPKKYGRRNSINIKSLTATICLISSHVINPDSSTSYIRNAHFSFLCSSALPDAESPIINSRKSTLPSLFRSNVLKTFSAKSDASPTNREL